ANVAAVVNSFVFDAGVNSLSGFWLYSTLPVLVSSTSMPQNARDAPGSELMIFWMRSCSCFVTSLAFGLSGDLSAANAERDPTTKSRTTSRFVRPAVLIAADCSMCELSFRGAVASARGLQRTSSDEEFRGPQQAPLLRLLGWEESASLQHRDSHADHRIFKAPHATASAQAIRVRTQPLRKQMPHLLHETHLAIQILCHLVVMAGLEAQRPDSNL